MGCTCAQRGGARWSQHEDARALHWNVTLRLLGTSEQANPDYAGRIFPTGIFG